MSPPSDVISTVTRLLADTPGLSVCHDPPADPARPGAFDPIPTGLHPELAACLARAYPGGLYRHQRAALDHILAGRHTVVATRTSSGKSLIYSVPVLNGILTDPDATALFLFPQKALANDQLQRLAALADSCPTLAALRAANPHLVARYDGATADAAKPAIRTQARILLTNTDMLHYAVLAWHDRHWQRFLGKLKCVVVDECHEYRGMFGTNVSYLFRRLRALCRRYGSSPTFVATSATVADPAAHLERLTGLPFACVGPDADGSRQGARKFWLVQSRQSPPDHSYDVGRKLTLAMAEAGLSVLCFTTSRKATEQMSARSGGDKADPPFVRPYRAGLLPEEREEIETGLKNGTVRAVFATSALELGIDIGALDAVVCVGLPTTMMSLWQRAGRAGGPSR